jgi:hypothetical protein
VNFDEGFLWDIIDCYCRTGYNSKNTYSTGVLTMQTLLGGENGVVNVENLDTGSMAELYVMEQLHCSGRNALSNLKGKQYVRITGQSFNPIGYYVANVDAHGNVVDYNNTSPNVGVLRVTSSSLGNSSSVRFNVNSSAFERIVKGLVIEPTDYTFIKKPEVRTNGYVYRDGVSGYAGYAHGVLSIERDIEGASLHSRLGDCSTTNLTLGIIVDGVEQSVIFNQDYSSMTDQEVIAAINSQLSGAVADIFIWGAEYYPEIKPNYHVLTNISSDVIPNGTVVSFRHGQLKPAENDEEVYGVAIDDIFPSCDGRVLTKCILSMYATNRFHVKMDNPPISSNDKYEQAYQTNFGIGTTPGSLVSKSDGIFTADYYGWLILNK